MRLGTAVRAGVLSSVAAALTVMSAPALGSVSAAGAAGPVVHAPRIPGPAPARSSGGGRAGIGSVAWASPNWSGYRLLGSGFTSVSGSWVVPTVAAPVRRGQYRKSMYSGTWVGIDGWSNHSLIQAGTEQDWLGGVASYRAWWEILPLPEQVIGNFPVHPGDTMSVTITQGSPNWTIALRDVTTGQLSVTFQPYSGPMTSAEWIHEAPTVGRRVATLPVESPVVFDLATANGVDPNLQAPSDAGALYRGRALTWVSTPSVPDSDGDGFTVAYGSVAPPPRPS